MDSNSESHESSEISDEKEKKEKSDNNLLKQKKFSNIFYNKYNSMKILYQNIYNNIMMKSNLNYNFEIQVEFVKNKNKKTKTNTLNNFVVQSPNSLISLNIDTNDKNYNLEIKLNEIKTQI